MDHRKEVEQKISDEKERKRVKKAAAFTIKPKKIKECSNPACCNESDISTSKLKKDNEKSWTHCSAKKGTIWGCPDHTDMDKSHMTRCKKIAENE
jgi:hypothetical protein